MNWNRSVNFTKLTFKLRYYQQYTELIDELSRLHCIIYYINEVSRKIVANVRNEHLDYVRSKYGIYID